MKAIVYGMGCEFDANKERLDLSEIICFCDTNKKGEWFGNHQIHGPEYIPLLEHYDVVYVTTTMPYWESIVQTLLSFDVPCEKIEFPFFQKYRVSVDKSGVLVGTYNGVSVALKCLSDYLCFEADFINMEYGVNFPFANTIVFDIGMNSATTALYFATFDNVKKVYGFEPFGDTYNNALDNIHRNPQIGEKIKPLKMALAYGDYSKEVPIFEDDNTGGRTTCEDFFDHPVYTRGHAEFRRELIEFKDARNVLERLMRDEQADHYVMKIDVEGSEFDIFKSLETSLVLDRMDAILMEYHSEPTYLTKILEDKKLRYLKNYWGEGRGMIFAFKY